MPYKLYLADDSITIQKVVELTLSEEDFEVTAFGDGESALDAARKAAPDIILADIVMPRMDGYQLSQAVKRDPALKNVPVLLLAGTFENFDTSLAASSMADGHIIKPFESSELINKVKELAEKKARMAPAPPDKAPMEAQAPPQGYAQPVDALPFDEPPAEEILDAEPVDDLWSVVDMQTDDQPLAGASEVMSYFASPSSKAEEEKLPWDDVPLDAVMEDDEGAVEAILADDDDSIFVADEAPEETLEAVEAEEVVEAEEAEPAGGLDDFMRMPFVPVSAEVEEKPSPMPFDVPPAAPAASPASSAPVFSPGGLSAEPGELHGLVEARLREVIAGMSSDAVEKVVWEVVPPVVEKIVWEVVPALAEQIILKEIERLKAES